MPRLPFVAANWKMHKTVGEAVDYAGELVPRVRDAAGVDIVLAPPFPALPALVDALAGLGAGGRIAVAAQNVHAEPQGAFTGEVSLPMLQACGVTAVIVGHSERRQLFGETDAGVNAKTRAAAAAGLTPIVCVGETLKNARPARPSRARPPESRRPRGLRGSGGAPSSPTTVWAIAPGASPPLKADAGPPPHPGPPRARFGDEAPAPAASSTAAASSPATPAP